MMTRQLLSLTCLTFCIANGPLYADETAFTAQQVEFFERKIRPIFAEHCHGCHGPETQEAHLRLDSREAVLLGGETGPAVVPGEPDAGELLAALLYDPDGYQMPPDGKLPEETIALVTEWVRMGAPWPEEAAGAAGGREEFDLHRRAEHWSFQPLRPGPVPEVSQPDWCRSPVDRFILSALEANDLTPAEEADRRTWIRRVFLDVIGLPPTPEEVRAFVEDPAPQAHARIVDRLLGSPHFGERWGRHWLDLVRYAESRGHEFDYEIPNAWQYRDYVIRALNEDVPYDRFIAEHVAGDLLLSPASPSSLPPSSSEDRQTERAEVPATRYPQRRNPVTGANESILGTGFWFLGEWVHSPVDIRQEEGDRFENMIDVYSKTFLGLTVACARCHDHKFDPIRQKDYYALQGYLQSTSYQQAPFETMDHNRKVAGKLTRLDSELGRRVRGTIEEQAAPVLTRLEDYLTAAGNALRAGGEGPAEDVAALAEKHRLDADLLSRWAAHLQKAAEDDTDPFHDWSRGQPPSRGSLDDRLPQFEVETVIAAQEMIPAGVGFRRLEEPALREAGGALRFNESLGYQWDPLWFELNAPKANMQDPGALETWNRGGRMLRTPTFEIESGRIFALVRGKVNTYLSVASHILIKGPLHGALAKQHEQNPDWHWIDHQVNGYAGHRAHLEFIPQPGEEFAVAIVLQAQTHPGALPPAVPAGEIFVDLPLQRRSSPAEWERPGENRLFLNWILDHPELFGLDAEPIEQELRDVRDEFLQRRAELAARIRKTSHTAPCMLEGSPEDEYVFIRGSWKRQGETVPRRYLEVFGGGSGGADPGGTESVRGSGSRSLGSRGSGRLELVEQMVDPERTPILPRVLVNRIWKQYFGRGIVPTPDDFGHLGQPPTHPELLDWLANELVRRDWSMKAIHREILLSSAYRMSSALPARRGLMGASAPGWEEERSGSFSEEDPGNLFFSRMNVKRLEGEIIRDVLLAISGSLNPQTQGPSVPIHLTPFLEGRGRPAESGPVDGAGRRSIYLAVRRNFPQPFFQAFDMPNPHTSIGQRNVSNVPAQALAMLNNPLIIEQSRVWADRLLRELPEENEARRIDRLFETAFSRPATELELEAGKRFLTAQAEEQKTNLDAPRVWADYCHVLLNLKEFLFVR